MFKGLLAEQCKQIGVNRHEAILHAYELLWIRDKKTMSVRVKNTNLYHALSECIIVHDST